uniref:MIT_C domain-containing protein n=1 Tax=Strongyloides papillosus TaxID=174720 RepID=A0A0N5BVN6_STREA
MSQDFFVEVICDIKDKLEIAESLEDYSKKCEFIEDIEYLMEALKIAPPNQYPEIEEVKRQVNNFKMDNNFLSSTEVPSCSYSSHDDSDYVIENFNDIKNEREAVEFVRDEGDTSEYISGLENVATKALNLYHATSTDHCLHSEIFDFYLGIRRELDKIKDTVESPEVEKEYDKNSIRFIDKKGKCLSPPSSPDSSSWSDVVSKKSRTFGVSSTKVLSTADRIRDNIPIDPRIPGSVPKKELHSNAKYLGTRIIKEKTVGHGFESIFGEYIRFHKSDSSYRPIESVTVKDPYLSEDIQVKNILDFFKYCWRNINTLKKFEIITEAPKSQKNIVKLKKTYGRSKTDNQIVNMLSNKDSKIRCSMSEIENHCKSSGVGFNVKYEENIHERYVYFDNGIFCSLERGFDFYYYNYNNSSDRNEWNCKATHIVFYCL